jgi:hypothetical protein
MQKSGGLSSFRAWRGVATEQAHLFDQQAKVGRLLNDRTLPMALVRFQAIVTSAKQVGDPASAQNICDGIDQLTI